MERCPDMKTIRAGDESMDYCKLNDKMCLLVGDYRCEYYEEYLKEIKED